jgi:hypothetical protein
MHVVADGAKTIILGGTAAAKLDMAWRRYGASIAEAFEVLVVPGDATGGTLAFILHHVS